MDERLKHETPQPPKPGVVWEYDAYTISGPAGDLGLIAGMNKMGLDGWECIGFRPDGPIKQTLAGQRQKWILYLKRPERAVRAASAADMALVTADVTIPNG